MSQVANDSNDIDSQESTPAPCSPDPVSRDKAIMTPASAGFGSPDPAVAPWTSSTEILRHRHQPAQKAKPSFLDSENKESEFGQPSNPSLTHVEALQAAGQSHHYENPYRTTTNGQNESEVSAPSPRRRHRNFVPSTHSEDEAMVGADEESPTPKISDETSLLPRQESSNGPSFLTRARMKSAHLNIPPEIELAGTLTDWEPNLEQRKRHIDSLFEEDFGEDAPSLLAQTKSDRLSMLDTGRKKGLLPISSTAPSVDLSLNDSPPPKISRAMRGKSAMINNDTSSNILSSTHAKLASKPGAKFRLPALELEEDKDMDEVGDDPFHNSHIPPSRGASPAAVPKAKLRSDPKKERVTRPSKPASQQKRNGANRRQKAKLVSLAADHDFEDPQAEDFADDLVLPNDDEHDEYATRVYTHLPLRPQKDPENLGAKDVITITSGSSVYDTDEDYIDSQPRYDRARGTSKSQLTKVRNSRTALRAQKVANEDPQGHRNRTKENKNAVQINVKPKVTSKRSVKKATFSTLPAIAAPVAIKSVPKKRTSPIASLPIHSTDTANQVSRRRTPSIDGSNGIAAYTISPVQIERAQRDGLAGHDADRRHAPVVSGHAKEAAQSTIIACNSEGPERDEEFRKDSSTFNCHMYRQDIDKVPQLADLADVASNSEGAAQTVDPRYTGEINGLSEEATPLVASAKLPSTLKIQNEHVKSEALQREAVDSAVDFPTSLERTTLRGAVAPRKQAVQDWRIREVREGQGRMAVQHLLSNSQSDHPEQSIVNNGAGDAETAHHQSIAPNKFPAVQKLDDCDQGQDRPAVSTSDESGVFFIIPTREQTQAAPDTVPAIPTKHADSLQGAGNKAPKRGYDNRQRAVPSPDPNQPPHSFDCRVEMQGHSHPLWSYGTHQTASSTTPDDPDVGRVSKRPRLGLLADRGPHMPTKPGFSDKVSVPVHVHSSDDVFGFRKTHAEMHVDRAVVRHLRDNISFRDEVSRSAGAPARAVHRFAVAEPKAGRMQMVQGQSNVQNPFVKTGTIAEAVDWPHPTISFEPSHDDEMRDRVGGPTSGDDDVPNGRSELDHARRAAAEDSAQQQGDLGDIMHRVVKVTVLRLYSSSFFFARH